MIMILKKRILGPQRTRLNNKWETGPKTACSQQGTLASGAWGLGIWDFDAYSEFLIWLLALRLLCVYTTHVRVFLFQPSTHFL